LYVLLSLLNKYIHANMNRRPSFRLRHFLSSPSVAGMAFDLGNERYTGVAYNDQMVQASGRSINNALSLRLEELLVFEIREDGYVR
jgi:hypothetical protein